MGSITIAFVHNPTTKQKELWIDYKSAADWLPAEHERRHREIMKQLLDSGKVDPSTIDRVHVRVEGEEVHVELLEDENDYRTESKSQENKS